MHYRDGTPAELGDKVTVADPDYVTEPGIPDYYLTEQGRAERTGIVIGRDTKGTCGVVIFRPTGNAPRQLGYTAICTQSQDPQLFIVEGFAMVCEPKFLRKIA